MSQPLNEMYRSAFVSSLKTQLAAVEALKKRLGDEDDESRETWRRMTNDMSKSFLQTFGSFLRENPFHSASSESLGIYASMLQAGLSSLEDSND